MSHPLIGILGGTFDPIHVGHLQMADAFMRTLQLDEIRFVPCNTPVLKESASASEQHRTRMLEIALANKENFILDKRELERETPSYTVLTLESLRSEFKDAAFCLCLGIDAFMDLPKWYQWQRLLTLTHIVVCQRQSYVPKFSSELEEVVQQHRVKDPNILRDKNVGAIYFSDVELPFVSATEIRQMVGRGEDPSRYLPSGVMGYIHRERLYRS